VRVFLAGATGVIGRRLVPRLRAAGHDVVGLTRKEHAAGALREAGAEPVVGDALDPDTVREAVAAARPDAIVNELTDIPEAIDPRKADEQFAGNDRLRREGTKNLVEAAKAAGTGRIVSQSIAFAYKPDGPPVKSEDDPLATNAAGSWRRSVQALSELERLTVEAGGLALRYGYFYGPGSAYAPDGHLAGLVKKRRYPIVGKGSGVTSFVHVDDAADATVHALERGSPGPYNVVDDEPARVDEWLPVYAEALGAPAPRHVPKFVARLAAGPMAVRIMTEQRGASNERAKSELGWSPRFASWRTGFKEGLG
jgi:nucleoside-diphosphate-sugar epimerase